MPVPPVETSPGEEIANSVTHGVGAALSIAALVVMVVLASLNGTARQVVSCAIYGSSLVLLYLSSTLYHALKNGRAKRVFRILDHASIYVLIAGTYTPFTLMALGGGWGWSLFGVIWGLAAMGVVFKSFLTGRFQVLSTAVYILMGWLALVAIRPLLSALPVPALLWLFAGGVLYTTGVTFFAWRRKYAHAVWHLFVVAASACHFYAVYRYVLGGPV